MSTVLSITPPAGDPGPHGYIYMSLEVLKGVWVCKADEVVGLKLNKSLFFSHLNNLSRLRRTPL